MPLALLQPEFMIYSLDDLERAFKQGFVAGFRANHFEFCSRQAEDAWQALLVKYGFVVQSTESPALTRTVESSNLSEPTK